jgi:hypothetical protein
VTDAENWKDILAQQTLVLHCAIVGRELDEPASGKQKAQFTHGMYLKKA